MSREYLILGVILIVMGAVQVWLRHGPGSKLDGGDERSESDWDPANMPRRFGGAPRSSAFWRGWTAILGLVAIGLGIVMVVLGVLGG